MKTRVALVVALLASLAVTGLNFTAMKRSVLSLQSRLKSETLALERAETELAGTSSQLQQTLTGLKECKTSLEAAVTEKDKAVAETAFHAKRAQELTETLSTTQQRLEETQSELARYHATGAQPEQIAGMVGQIRTLQKDLIAVSKERDDLAARQPPLVEPVLLPAELRGRVLAYDPKWRFVVLDAGKEQGVLPKGELLVSRNGQLVGKVKVSTVEKSRSVASLMAGWELSEILEGDLLIPAHPRS